MRISIRRGYAATPETITCTWDQFVQFAKASASTTYATKEDQPHLVLAATRGSFKAQDIDPEGFWAIALDYDDVSAEAFTSAILAVQRVTEHGIAHTTWAHCASEGYPTDGSYVRARILVPLDEPIPVAYELAARIALGSSIEAVSGCSPDSETLKTSARFWFAPGTNPNAPAWAKPCWIEAW